MPASSQPLFFVVPLTSDLGLLGMRLRREVFVGEQHVPQEEEADAYDATATHVVALENGTVVGALRMIFLDEHVKFGRVVVAMSARGRGLGAQLMRFAMDHARATGHDRFYLGAQTDKVAFYERLGFTAFGDQFQDGGMPHYAMKNY
jgi:predicted GNAT family N-acyltransferase